MKLKHTLDIYLLTKENKGEMLKYDESYDVELLTQRFL